MDTFWSLIGTSATVVFGVLVGVLLAFNIILRLTRLYLSRAEHKLVTINEKLPDMVERRESTERGIHAAEALNDEIAAIWEKLKPLADLTEQGAAPELWAEREVLIARLDSKLTEAHAVLDEVKASHAEHGEQLLRVERMLDRAKSESKRAAFFLRIIDFLANPRVKNHTEGGSL
jgi:hypothetical protein